LLVNFACLDRICSADLAPQAQLNPDPNHDSNIGKNTSILYSQKGQLLFIWKWRLEKKRIFFVLAEGKKQKYTKKDLTRKFTFS
jgi:hypothetical protein